MILNQKLYLKDTHYQSSPLMQEGLEIPVKTSVRMGASTENAKAIKMFKQLVHQQTLILGFEENMNVTTK